MSAAEQRNHQKRLRYQAGQHASLESVALRRVLPKDKPKLSLVPGASQEVELVKFEASLVMRDLREEVTLVADVVQHRSAQPSGAQLKQFAEHFGGVVQFLLLADLEKIEIFSAVDGQRLHSFETREIIHCYDATAEAPYAYYLTSLVEAWLSDLLSQWKSPSAPKKAELVESGFLAALQGASVERL